MGQGQSKEENLQVPTDVTMGGAGGLPTSSSGNRPTAGDATGQDDEGAATGAPRLHPHQGSFGKLNLYHLFSFDDDKFSLITAKQFGADTTYNYDQFHLHTREQKIYQIAMLKVCNSQYPSVDSF